MWRIASVLLITALLGSISEAAVASSASRLLRRDAAHESVAPDIDPRALWDGRKTYEEFRACSSPRIVPAANASFLIDDEYVLGVTVDGQSRAYPTRFAAWHHVVNDRMTNPTTGVVTPIAITFCIVCNTGMAFDPVVDGRTLQLDFYGLYNGVLTMYDHGTRSVWLQVGGRAVKGPMIGRRLRCLPVLDTTWRNWKRLHPDTFVMAPDPAFRGYYEQKGTVMPRGYDRFPDPSFRRTLTRRDGRLPMFSSVLAVTIPPSRATGAATVSQGADSSADTPAHRAYPLSALKKRCSPVNDEIASIPVAVLFDPTTETATAVLRKIDGAILTFETRKTRAGKPTVVDRETGTQWNVEGLGISGPLAGRSLERLDSCLSQWYGWSAYYPDTTIYRSGPNFSSMPIVSGQTAASGRSARKPYASRTITPSH